MPIKGSFDEQIKSIEDAVLKAHKNTLREIYEALLSPGISRVFSGYFKSNHRVILGKTGSARLVPATRPNDATSLQFIDNVEAARAEELAKIASIKPFTESSIGTAVPYAEILEAVDVPVIIGC